MENSFIGKIEISRGKILPSGIMQKPNVVLPNINNQIQFIMSRTDELRTVLKEIDETLRKIKEESQKSFINAQNYL
ncbi:MAG: hypothetical protein U5J96_04635 [Ignavibacteriaceae bacterium]|nr:hypothetical protein [Ignavibacteriaceae bacterium]